MTETNKQQKIPFMVRVGCMTFNQAPYIEDAMNGFCMQETTFPFVCTIIDDASTDGEPEVIKKYLQEHFDLEDKSIVRNEETDDYVMTFARHRTNLNCYFAVLYLKYNHYSIKKDKMPYIKEWCDTKYIALCEGDDFWIHPQKLQRQLNALENNPECMIVFCRVQKVIKDGSAVKGKTLPRRKLFQEGFVTLDDLLKEELYNIQWCFHTSSFFMRSECCSITKERQNFMRKFAVSDFPTEIWCLLHGKGYFVNCVGSCYRMFSGGWLSNQRQNKELEIAHAEKSINVYRYLNTITEKQYDKYFSNSILYSRFLVETKKGHKWILLRKEYRPLILRFSTRKICSYLLQMTMPSIYVFYIKNRKSF